MANKESKLKKTLIKNAIIVAIIMGVFLGAGIGVSFYLDSKQEEQAQKQGENDHINAQYKEIEEELGTQLKVSAYYENYIKDHNSNFLISREAAPDLLSALRKQNHLANNIEANISSIADLNEAAFKLKSGTMVKSDIHIVFGALTDNSVYNFIYDLQHKLPGIVLVYDLKLTRIGELNQNNIISTVTRHSIVPLVSGELSFTWLGIRPNPEPVPANGLGNGK